MRKRLEQVDSETGEILGEFVAYVAPKKINGFGQGWLAMAQNPAMSLAQSDLGLNDYRVFLALVAKIDFENLLILNQAEIARELGINRQTVQRSIKVLIKHDVLLEGPRVGINRSYRLNPDFGWKCSAKNHKEALNSQREEKMRAAGIREVISGKKSKTPKSAS